VRSNRAGVLFQLLELQRDGRRGKPQHLGSVDDLALRLDSEQRPELAESDVPHAAKVIFSKLIRKVIKFYFNRRVALNCSQRARAAAESRHGKRGEPMSATTLHAFLAAYEKAGDGPRAEIAEVVRRLAHAAIGIRDTIGSGAFERALPDAGQGINADGDLQKALDVHADRAFHDAMRQAPVAWYASEEREAPVRLNPDAGLVLAIDPLDGSSNIEIDVSIGTIFSILPAAADADPAASFRQPGRRQLAAGFFIYGPQLVLVLTLGEGTHGFRFSRSAFAQLPEPFAITPRTREFAINASNYRHWGEAVRSYVDDCLKGADGPRERDFNMRWIASLVAEAYRILARGGVFLYPGDERPGYSHGRLRLVYEANPIAFLVEQAGGTATDTVGPILDLIPQSLHERVPLVFGSAREVARISRYHIDPAAIAERSPLFGKRGLFRA
jgi:fructose-1,6-bisphosphatase I